MIRTSLKRVTQVFVMAVSMIGATVHADINDSSMSVKWGYVGNTGPERWAQLDPRFNVCAAGKTQSPINITKTVKPVPNSLTVNYSPATLDILADGSTHLQIKDQATVLNDGHTIQVNFPAGQASETITYKGLTYKLVQFHLHTPSENEINGQTWPMEIHFVHQGDNGNVAVIGVLITSGAANPELDKIIAHLPTEKGQEVVLKNVKILPVNLLPEKYSYYSFDGSLTTPPCSEGLNWIVMAGSITASPVQIVELRKAIGGENARAVQPLNKRQIYFSAA